MFGPMDLSRSGAKVQMQPDTGVTFNDVVGVDGAKLVRITPMSCPVFPLPLPSHPPVCPLPTPTPY
jgi:hypothetical protein